jgi:hypothetical protein
MFTRGRSGKALLLGLALSGFLLVGGMAPARAAAPDRDDKCERQIRKADENWRKQIRRHGERSRQAEKARRQLEEARERCHRGRDRDHDRDRDHYRP